MANFLIEFFSSFFASFKNLPFGKKLGILTLITFFITTLMILAIWAGRSEYRMLYSNLTPEDAGEIITKLNEWKIPYELGGGSIVMIPQNKLYKVRLDLAREGLPRGGGVGFEIFDRTNLGTTEFVQKLNFQRALQGELGRTISQFSEVSQARVHIAIPQKSLFIADRKQSSASVVLKLHSGRKLREDQVRGIVYLVASSVEGLEAKNITVVNTGGDILFSGESEFSMSGQLGNSQFKFRQNIENNLERKIQSMLEKIVGSNKVVVRASAIIDFKQSEITEEVYDPEKTAVRSEQRSDEKSKGGSAIPAGTPNIALSSPSSQVAGSASEFKKAKETINYEINKTTRIIINPTGNIERISVAVLVDGNYESVEGDEKQKYLPRSQEEMSKIRNIVEKAMGYDPQRGDQLEVSNIPFETDFMKMEENLMKKAEKKEFIFTIIKNTSYAILFFLFFIFVFRPFVKWIATMSRELESVKSLPSKAGELEAKPSSVERESGISGKDEALKLAQSDPYKAAQLVRDWLVEKE